jgi:non-ribosomal peptide synthetase component F
MRELGACYAAYAAGREPALPRLAVQYADFAAWQRSWLRGERLEAQLAYWRRQLADVVDAGELFPRRQRPRRPGRRVAFHTLRASAELTAGLKQLGRRHDVTLFMTVLAALEVLLHAESGRTRFTLGTELANRRDARLEPLVGFFVNQLVLRADLEGDPTFEALLGRVRAVTLGAYEHQDLPFQHVVEALRPERDAGRYPLFQVLFGFENVGAENVPLPGLEVQPFPAGRRETIADLIITGVEQPAGLVLAFEYDADLFDPERVTRLGRKLERLLASVAADASAPLQALVAALAPLDRAARRTRRKTYAAALERSLRRSAD